MPKLPPEKECDLKSVARLLDLVYRGFLCVHRGLHGRAGAQPATPLARLLCSVSEADDRQPTPRPKQKGNDKAGELVFCPKGWRYACEVLVETVVERSSNGGIRAPSHRQLWPVISFSSRGLPEATHKAAPGKVNSGRQSASCSFSAATPTARLTPTSPSSETGCSETVLLVPPTSTLAPPPTPTLASAVTPA
jgi:hypothetical protein